MTRCWRSLEEERSARPWQRLDAGHEMRKGSRSVLWGVSSERLQITGSYDEEPGSSTRCRQRNHRERDVDRSAKSLWHRGARFSLVEHRTEPRTSKLNVDILVDPRCRRHRGDDPVIERRFASPRAAGRASCRHSAHPRAAPRAFQALLAPRGPRDLALTCQTFAAQLEA
jgi:hypothetical protein